MPAQQNRALFRAVLLSLAVHAAFLFGQLPAVRHALDKPASQPIVARLAEPVPPAPEPVEPPKKAELPPPAPPRPRERAPEVEKPPPLAAPRGELPAEKHEPPP